MATRSRIGKMLPDGNVKSIYCHWDGYIAHNGVILKEHYKDEAKIDALLELGDLSVLGSEIGEKQDFEGSRREGWCLAYGRDRGEEGIEASVSSLEEMISEAFHYIWDNGKWKCFDYHGEEIKF